MCEYNYYLFSPNAAAKIDAHADKSVEIKVYESAITKQLDSYKEVLENEVLVMNKIGQ